MSEFTIKPILVCDMQPVAIEGVRGLLDRCDDLRFAGAVASLEAAFELARALNPAAVVIDKAFGTPAITGLAASIRRIPGNRFGGKTSGLKSRRRHLGQRDQ